MPNNQRFFSEEANKIIAEFVPQIVEALRNLTDEGRAQIHSDYAKKLLGYGANPFHMNEYDDSAFSIALGLSKAELLHIFLNEHPRFLNEAAQSTLMQHYDPKDFVITESHAAADEFIQRVKSLISDDEIRGLLGCANCHAEQKNANAYALS